MGAHERAYLDQLERMILSPGMSPYLRRGPVHQPRGSDAVEPVYDSGPMKPGQIEGPQAESVAAARSVSPRAAASLATEDGKIRLGADGVYELEIEVPRSDLPPEDEYQRPEPVRPSEMRPTPPPKAAATPAPPSASEMDQAFQQAVAQSKVSPASQNLFPDGTLVRWNGGELGIYRQHVESKGYDLIYVAEADGRLQPKGVCLAPYQPHRVGMLSQGILQWMESTMRWDRDALLYHLDNPAEANTLRVLSQPSQPQSGGGTTEATANGRWVRGRTFTIKVGKHKWRGVFWGKDALGTIVAHNTNRVWSLIHMDLKRYGDGIEYGEVLSAREIEKIEAAVSAQE
ncbi:MAG: hypothetical protein N3D11_05520 [Candidatus Sumerlaeia bacterium]|nr:hypothetical protein [Candidatus Sumerlaeia bacterium]